MKQDEVNKIPATQLARALLHRRNDNGKVTERKSERKATSSRANLEKARAARQAKLAKAAA